MVGGSARPASSGRPRSVMVYSVDRPRAGGRRSRQPPLDLVDLGPQAGRPRRARPRSSRRVRARSRSRATDEHEREQGEHAQRDQHDRVRRHSGRPYRGAGRGFLTPDDAPDPLPALLDRGLGAQRGGLVVARVGDHVGGVLLLGDAERLVVAVGVGLPVADLLRARVVGVAQVRRHRPDLAGADVGAGGVDRLDHGVGLRRDGQRDRGLGEVEPGLGHPDQLHRLGGGHGGRQGGRVGQADVLAGQDHQPAGDEPRVLPRLDHPGQVVQRGVGVGAADRLDEGAGDVVVLVALPVVAHRGLVDGGLRGGQVDDRGALGGGRAGRRLEVGQRPAGVAAGQPDQVVAARRRRASPRRPGRARRRAPARRRRGRRRRSATPAGAAGCATAAARSRRRTGSRSWRRPGSPSGSRRRAAARPAGPC